MPAKFQFGESNGLGDIQGRLFDIQGVPEINAGKKTMSSSNIYLYI